MKQNLVLAAVLIALLTGAGVFLVARREAPAALDSFAQCLAGKGATMYGADWCPHCQNEKRAFGDAFRIVPYVECPEDPGRCLAAGISGFPTWIFADGRRFEGEQGVTNLAAASGCPLPSGR